MFFWDIFTGNARPGAPDCGKMHYRVGDHMLGGQPPVGAVGADIGLFDSKTYEKMAKNGHYAKMRRARGIFSKTGVV